MQQDNSLLSVLQSLNCIHCGEPIYRAGLVCHRCTQHNLGTKREIYDSEQVREDSFSDAYFGEINYRKMRKRNISTEKL